MARCDSDISAATDSPRTIRSKPVKPFIIALAIAILIGALPVTYSFGQLAGQEQFRRELIDGVVVNPSDDQVDRFICVLMKEERQVSRGKLISWLLPLPLAGWPTKGSSVFFAANQADDSLRDSMIDVVRGLKLGSETQIRLRVGRTIEEATHGIVVHLQRWLGTWDSMPTMKYIFLFDREDNLLGFAKSKTAS